jgi:uncharacterized protein YerC
LSFKHHQIVTAVKPHDQATELLRWCLDADEPRSTQELKARAAREAEIIRLKDEGRTVREIAAETGASIGTIARAQNGRLPNWNSRRLPILPLGAEARRSEQSCGVALVRRTARLASNVRWVGTKPRHAGINRCPSKGFPRRVEKHPNLKFQCIRRFSGRAGDPLRGGHPVFGRKGGKAEKQAPNFKMLSECSFNVLAATILNQIGTTSCLAEPALKGDDCEVPVCKQPLVYNIPGLRPIMLNIAEVCAVYNSGSSLGHGDKRLPQVLKLGRVGAKLLDDIG